MNNYDNWLLSGDWGHASNEDHQIAAEREAEEAEAEAKRRAYMKAREAKQPTIPMDIRLSAQVVMQHLEIPCPELRAKLGSLAA